MDLIKRQPILFAVLFAGLGVLGAEIYLVQQAKEKARRAALMLQQRKQDRDWLASRSPALSQENSDAIAADLAAAEKALATLRSSLEGKRKWLPTAPSRPIDAYFAIASFTEQMRTLAVRQQVALRPEERFGFASYANEGPEIDLLPAVHAQRVVVQHLLETLFEAKPKALIAVQRERPLTVAQRDARRAPPPDARDSNAVQAAAVAAQPRLGGQAADFFALDPRLQLQAAGLVEGTAFRVEFTGQTQTLRTFLNSINHYRVPLIVRSVEVEPLAGSTAQGEGPLAPNAAVPLVSDNISKFAVTLECVEVLPVPNSTAP